MPAKPSPSTIATNSASRPPRRDRGRRKQSRVGRAQVVRLGPHPAAPPERSASDASAARTRFRSLDVFRGAAVAAMVLVNSPGSDAVFSPLRHADWHGCTLADLVFPAFLVIMGAAAAFARADAARALRRAAALFALGLLANWFLGWDSGIFRWPGVLQRIALCYLGVEAFLVADRPSAEPWAIAALLAGYWLLIARSSVPGYGASDLTSAGNIASWLDRRLFAGHLINDPYGDPEGLLSTIPALGTSLFGLVAGRRLAREGPSAAAEIGSLGALLAAFGIAWGRFFPFNKHLWTSSFALFSGGVALAGLAACVLAVESRRPRWAEPFAALGRHALAAYAVAGLAYGAFEFAHIKEPLTAELFASWLPAREASLGFALCFVAATLLVAHRAGSEPLTSTRIRARIYRRRRPTRA